LAGMEFITALTDPYGNINWSEYVERSNLQYGWLIEDMSNREIVPLIAEHFPKMLKAGKNESAKTLQAWLKPRLQNEEMNRSSTYPTLVVIQVLGLLGRDSLVELIEERAIIFGSEKIDDSDENYYYKKEILEKTLSPILPTLFRRAFGCSARENDSTYDMLTDYHDLFLNDIEEELDLIWKILKLNLLFGDDLYVIITNTVRNIIGGQILKEFGFAAPNFHEYLKNLDQESDPAAEEFRKQIISNFNNVSDALREQYSLY